jgi:glucose/arabinose dehydrogenase
MMKLILPLVFALVLAGCSDVATNTDTARDPAPATAASGGSVTAVSERTATAAPSGAAGAGEVRSGARQTPAYDPAAFRLALEPVSSGFRQPLFVTAAPDGSGRLFVVEQGGTIRIAQNGQVLSQPFLDISSLVIAGGERGLLGMAFHPRYAENGLLFVYYTARGNGDNTVARYRVSGDANRADPASARVLLSIADFASNHNAGMLAFGPDGYLYVGTGDGGGANDPQRNGQNRAAFLGKMLRLDVDNGDPYGIPRDNPFVGQGGIRPEIWAVGLRNPWRYSFDRATGDLWIADVGQNAWEEINVQPAGSRGGENYGWSIMEGRHCLRGSSCEQDGLTMPNAEYRNDGRSGDCSITGGYVYRGTSQPKLVGAYFLADFCSGRIYTMPHDGSSLWMRRDWSANITSFGEGEDGELYLVTINGRLYQVLQV